SSLSSFSQDRKYWLRISEKFLGISSNIGPKQSQPPIPPCRGVSFPPLDALRTICFHPSPKHGGKSFNLSYGGLSATVTRPPGPTSSPPSSDALLLSILHEVCRTLGSARVNGLPCASLGSSPLGNDTVYASCVVLGRPIERREKKKLAYRPQSTP